MVVLAEPKVPRGDRQAGVRETILDAAEQLFSRTGFNAVSIRDIARQAGVHAGSVSYHFKTKRELLRDIYRRHCGPMNRRRGELLGEARRVRDVAGRIEAILRAYLIPAFSSSSDHDGGGARFTRLRAILSAEGNTDADDIIAETFDEISHALIDALHESLPRLPRTVVVWRTHFLLGALYYTLINPDRVTRLSRGEADGRDTAAAIDQLVSATVHALVEGAGNAAPREGEAEQT